MVKVGFICEGRTETILLSSDTFTRLLASLNIEPLQIIDAKGSGNLLPHNISGYVERLEKAGAQTIMILTDLDEDICITKTKERISARQQDIVIIAVKKIEAWFLACTPAMRNFLQDDDFTFPLPENEADPFQTIKKLYKSRGIGKITLAKVRLATKMLESGFDFSTAAAHTNCSSARYLLDKLTQIGTK